MILAKDDIEKAVSWWAGKLMDHQPHSNGDDSFTSVAVCFLADTMRQSVTLDQLNTFKAALAKSNVFYGKRGGSGTGWLRCPGCQDLLR